jgi:magnesium-transporting ATPase (P-type)
MSYYNVIFTILPPLVIGIFDQYVSARMLDRYPQLYQLGQQNYFFTPQTFFYWVGNAFYHSVVSIETISGQSMTESAGAFLLLLCRLLWRYDLE